MCAMTSQNTQKENNKLVISVTTSKYCSKKYAPHALWFIHLEGHAFNQYHLKGSFGVRDKNK